MRFGKWRGVPITFAVAAILGMASTSLRADGWRLHYTIPREVPAYNYSTGGPYYAPPVPYGHYAKDYQADFAKAVAQLHGTANAARVAASETSGTRPWACSIPGAMDVVTTRARVAVAVSETARVSGMAAAGPAPGLSRAAIAASARGGGSFIMEAREPADRQAASTARVHPGADCCREVGHKKHFAPCHASTVASTGQVQPAGQTIVSPTGQSACGNPGCTITGRHSHLGNVLNKVRCHFCGGAGCGACGGAGFGDPCAACGGGGLLGGLGHGGHGNLCAACGGCGLGNGGTGCGLCGGKGCSNCLGGGHGLGSKVHGLLGSAMGMFHREKIDWFVGAGGPVPLTPGYVPYIVTTRSPRDYFAFPPMNPNDP